MNNPSSCAKALFPRPRLRRLRRSDFDLQLVCHTPEVPRCDGRVRAPVPRELLHLLVARQIFEFVERLKSFTDTEVAGRQYIWTVECKYKEHVYGPHTDTFDLREVFDNVRAFHCVQRTMFNRAVHKFLRKVFDIKGLLAGEPGRTHFLKRHRPHRFGSGELIFWKQREETRVYRLRRRARNLLVNNRTHERVERILAPHQIRRSVLFDKRSEALVAFECRSRFCKISLFVHEALSYCKDELSCRYSLQKIS